MFNMRLLFFISIIVENRRTSHAAAMNMDNTLFSQETMNIDNTLVHMKILKISPGIIFPVKNA